MKFEDQGIVVSSLKYGENSIIVSIFSENHGLVKGLTRGIKKNQSVFQVGNLVEYSWNARLEEHLGNISANLEKAYSLLCYHDYKKISAISSICSLTSMISQEKEKMSDFYTVLQQFFEDIVSEQDDASWLKDYCLAELELLKWSGFGFDFDSCSVSGGFEVKYISPKTGAVVSEETGKPYKDKLFTIPAFFLDYKANTDISDVLKGLEIVRFFINKNFFAEGLYKMPIPAMNFIELVFDSNQSSTVSYRE